jgi:hypothetical protein
MAKTHADRLSKYGKFGRYNDMIDNILAHNKADVAGKVINIQMDDWNKAFMELSAQSDAGQVRFVLPSASGTIPTKKVIHAKAVETGKIMSKTLRENLNKKMLGTLQDYIDEKKTPYMTKRGELRGKMDPVLIEKFEAKIKEAFEGYTKRDRTVGMPKNIHTIAVTEMRSAVSMGKKAYADKLKVMNPGLKLYKRWIHNDWLVQEPRPGHRALDERYGGQEIQYDRDFIVGTYKWMKNKYFKTGTIRMRHPHDPSAPLSEICGCQCDWEVFHKR